MIVFRYSSLFPGAASLPCSSPESLPSPSSWASPVVNGNYECYTVSDEDSKAPEFIDGNTRQNLSYDNDNSHGGYLHYST
ncbi:hypothetical protein SK128_001132, partial [Halocaridina rubra]